MEYAGYATAEYAGYATAEYAEYATAEYAEYATAEYAEYAEYAEIITHSGVRCASMSMLLLVGALLASSMADARDERLKRVLDDYIRLYARETLQEWRGLFLPTFVAGSTNDDGTVTGRTLDEFYERQRGFFATGRAIRESLENIRVDRDGRLATMRADFVLHDNDAQRRGRLMMLLIEARGEFRIQSLTFSYHLD